MSFIQLSSIEQLPHSGVYCIYKHSDCPIATRARGTISNFLETNNIHIYQLHVVDERTLSNQIADQFGVQHESPQLLVIQDGTVVAHESHFGIQVEWIEKSFLT